MTERIEDENVDVRPEDLGEPGATTTGIDAGSRNDDADDSDD
jgi:hypothetical protein